MKIFRNLALAFEALDKGGNSACVLNAANEVVVDAFLKGRMGFIQMSDIIEQTMAMVDFVGQPTIDDYIFTDKEARRKALELAEKIKIN